MQHIYLSRRNLLALLAKLDRNESKKTIVKYDTAHPQYPCTDICVVTAVEDDDYYADREPGAMHPYDEPREAH